jgi:hypothetical protein
MLKDNDPFLSDEFLDELAKEINQQFGGPTDEQNIEPPTNHINEIEG